MSNRKKGHVGAEWRHSRRGLSLVECVMAIAVFSVIIAATLHAAGAAITTTARATHMAAAGQLADSLMTEIMQEPYDSGDTKAVTVSTSVALLGLVRIVTEIPAKKGAAITLADYANYTDSTPINADGTKSTKGKGYTRSVRLEYVNVNSPDTTSLTDTGLCRVTVTVKYNGVPVLKRTGLRANLTTTN